MKRSKPLLSVALIPSSPKPRNDGKRMLTLTKKELTVLDQAQPDYEIHLIETAARPQPLVAHEDQATDA